MTERELIIAVKRKNDVACKELIEKYRNMIYSIINSFSLNKGDYRISEDELFQEGCIGIYEACVSYSKVKNCKFSTFLYAVIKRRIKKSICKQLDIYRYEYISYDKYFSSDKSGVFENKYVYDNPIEYSNKSFINKEVGYTISRLKSIDQKIIKLRLLNYSYDQISKMLNVPKKKIDNRLQYLKRKHFYKN